MTMTPWGDASTLRTRRLPPGRGRSRAEVERSQRQRLFAAMVALCAREGYAATGIGDLVELSGVSSRSFYDLFADKEDCFLATLEEILNAVEELAGAQLAGKGTMQVRAQRAATGLAVAVAAQPAAARFWIVEAFCGGERARRRVDEALARLTELLEEVFSGLPEQRGMPPELVRGIVGGVVGVLYRRLASGEAAAVPALAAGLHDWALSIPSPPQALQAKGRRQGRGEGSPPFAAHVPGERILRGFAAAVAEKGFAATTIADVAAAAAISQNTFYAHFKDKEDALFAALDSSGAQMVAAALPAIRRSPQWPGALRVALETICGFLVAEPAFARLREVEVYAVGPAAVRQRDRARAEVLKVLEALALDSPLGSNPLPIEATLGAIQSLLYERVRGGRAGAVAEVAPIATYIALAPSLGAEAACEVALG
jgi:AcrR family transcriptional regulator